METLTAAFPFDDEDASALFAPSLRWSGLSSLSGEPALPNAPPAPPPPPPSDLQIRLPQPAHGGPRNSHLSLASDRSWSLEFCEDPQALISLLDEEPPMPCADATTATATRQPTTRNDNNMDVVMSDGEDSGDEELPISTKRRATTGTSVPPPIADEDDFYLHVMENDLAAFEQEHTSSQNRRIALQEELIQRIPLVEDRAELKLGVYNQEQRERRLQHFREKRKQRVFGQVRYKLRQKASETRPRSKGRFVKQEAPETPTKHLRIDATSSSSPSPAQDIVMVIVPPEETTTTTTPSVAIPKDPVITIDVSMDNKPPTPFEQPAKKKKSSAFVSMAADVIAMMRNLSVRRRRTIAGTAPPKESFLGASDAATAAELDKKRRKSMPATPYDSVRRRFSFGAARLSTGSTSATSNPVSPQSAAGTWTQSTPQSNLTHRATAPPAGGVTPHKPNNGAMLFLDPTQEVDMAAANTNASKRRTMSFVIGGGKFL